MRVICRLTCHQIHWRIKNAWFQPLTQGSCPSKSKKISVGADSPQFIRSWFLPFVVWGFPCCTTKWKRTSWKGSSTSWRRSSQSRCSWNMAWGKKWFLSPWKAGLSRLEGRTPLYFRQGWTSTLPLTGCPWTESSSTLSYHCWFCS